ncbi:DUF1492 domain-containing protein [Streptococcus lutetiensis]|uniref:DUF1492 domain-containing protein n=1 Tax=Streptococcus lutetiensis TaxID=150055 RepID=UPI000FE1972A|nr:DUF1492 domain-containing protein [Streptococcus lutetiensis]RHB86130.1 DUF1492 domain-containing protein [Streptococcus lutetiensis]
MDIKDKLKNLHSINMLIESLERLLECDREEFKNFPELLEGLEQDSLQEIAKLKRQKLEIESLINSLDNDLQRKVLIEYYSHGYKWDKVADNLGYSKAYLSKVHSKAIKQLASMV